MKSKLYKRLFSLLIVLAMVLSMMPTMVFADGVEEETYPENYCFHCKKVVDWTEVTTDCWSGAALTTGHYKLQSKQTLSAKNTAITIAAGEVVCIDLNSYNITQTASVETASTSTGSKFARVFENSGTLSIMDSAAVTAEDGTYTSGVISGGWVTTCAGENKDKGGNIYNASGAEFNLYSGTISGGKARKHGIGASQNGGGNIYGESATINIFGGVVKDGQAYSTYSSTSTTSTNRTGDVFGGNISVIGGSLNISALTPRRCTASARDALSITRRASA